MKNFTYDDELYHYGVKGMKWHKRKDSGKNSEGSGNFSKYSRDTRNRHAHAGDYDPKRSGEHSPSKRTSPKNKSEKSYDKSSRKYRNYDARAERKRRNKVTAAKALLRIGMMNMKRSGNK